MREITPSNIIANRIQIAFNQIRKKPAVAVIGKGAIDRPNHLRTAFFFTIKEVMQSVRSTISTAPPSRVRPQSTKKQRRKGLIEDDQCTSINVIRRVRLEEVDGPTELDRHLMVHGVYSCTQGQGLKASRSGSRS